MNNKTKKNIVCPCCKKTTTINTTAHYLCEHCNYNLLPGAPKTEYKLSSLPFGLQSLTQGQKQNFLKPRVMELYSKTWGTNSSWIGFATGYD